MVLHGFLHGLREDHGASLAGSLGLVEGDVCILQELVGRDIDTLGDTDAGRHPQRLLTAGDGDRIGQGDQDPLGHDLGPTVARRSVDQHHELVPAQPSDDVPLAE